MRASARHGVNVLGYLDAEHGIGEAARQLVAAIRDAGIPTAAVTLDHPGARRGFPFDDDGIEAATHGTTIMCTTPHELARYQEQLGPEFFAGRHTIAYLWWELDALPAAWAPALERLDEIWVANDFVAESLRPATATEIRIVPLPVSVADVGDVPKAAVGLPDRFVFLFSFDFVTIFVRKNPLGLVEAYRRAFDESDGAFLLLKSIDGDMRPEALRELSTAIDDRPDIELRDGFVPPLEKDRLMAACDCYVSLHRCEGLGLTLAEAMLHGRPVIATGYSGNLGFMNDHNSFLVRYEPGRVPEGCEPFPVGAEWADPDLGDAARLMRLVFERPDAARAVARRGRSDVERHHSPDRVGAAIAARLAEIDRRRRIRRLVSTVSEPRRIAARISHTVAWPIRRPLDLRFGGLGREARERHEELLDRLAQMHAEALRLNHERASADADLLALARGDDARAAALAPLLAELRALGARLAALERIVGERLPSPFPVLDTDVLTLLRASRAQVASIPRPDGTVVCRVLGRYRMTLDPDDRPVASFLGLEGVWEPWNTIVVAREVLPGTTCLDVGANCGYFSLLMADLVGPSGQVIAIEPNPRLAGLAQENLWLNGLDGRGRVVQRAASDSTGRSVTLSVLPGRASQAAIGGGGDGLGIEVQTATVDELTVGSERVDFAKIDAEGSEQSIWAGMQATIERSPGIVLLMEVNRARYGDAEGFYRSIEEAGFPLREVDFEGRILPVTRRALVSRSGEATLYLRRGPPSRGEAPG